MPQTPNDEQVTKVLGPDGSPVRGRPKLHDRIQNTARAARSWILILGATIAFTAAIIGNLTQIRHAFQSDTPKIVHDTSLNSFSPPALKVVDVTHAFADDGQPALDVMLRNTSDQSCYIKLADIRVVDFYKLEWTKDFSHQPVTWTGNVVLPQAGPVPLSQVVPPKGTDRISFTFQTEGSEAYFDCLYELEFSFIYNETDSQSELIAVVLLMPRQHRITGFFGKKGDRSSALIEDQNNRAIQKFLNKNDAVIDPQLTLRRN